MLHKMYIDLETTGLDPVKNGVIQIAGTVKHINGNGIKFNFNVRPFDTDEITDEALKVTGKTREEIFLYPSPQEVYNEFMSLILDHIDRYNKKQKFLFIGYNSRFDNDFLRAWFEKCGDKYFGSYFFYPPIDVMNLAAHVFREDRDQLPNFKLGTIAEKLGITIPEGEGLHDAGTDIFLTMEIEKVLTERLKDNSITIS